MLLEPMGDSAYLIRALGGWHPAALADALRTSEIDGIEDSVAAYDTVAIYVNPLRFSVDRVKHWFSTAAHQKDPSGFRLHRVPVCYELGEDLDALSGILQLAPEEIIRLHTSVEYQCVAIGFCPGFPYLGYLPTELWGSTRRPEPRIRVPKRSVALTGKQTGIYPSETPGGWWLVGRTPLEIVDLQEAYFPISAGDRVQFVAISQQEYNALEGQRL